MRERVEDSRLVEWIRELFSDADAISMIRWMLLAWLALAVGAVILDRISTALLGRSRPLVQKPPAAAREWRWRRAIAPATYSMLPSGTTVSEGTAARPQSIPLAQPQPQLQAPAPPLALPAAPMSNNDYWARAADPTSPPFGYENVARLQDALPPERYNPVLLAVEALEREEQSGELAWPSMGEALRLGFDGLPAESAATEEE
ncbi:MAG: hypothetical protein HKN94_02680 [Acidimicrobiales bacterium]|nr:hypothetical protein [Acidimicrobiales bacterium]RZV47178.1 MAG: hypothetical protein EX269_05360 [Acidimicrobiales bacterium]